MSFNGHYVIQNIKQNNFTARHFKQGRPHGRARAIQSLKRTGPADPPFVCLFGVCCRSHRGRPCCCQQGSASLGLSGCTHVSRAPPEKESSPPPPGVAQGPEGESNPSRAFRAAPPPPTSFAGLAPPPLLFLQRRPELELCNPSAGSLCSRPRSGPEGGAEVGPAAGRLAGRRTERDRDRGARRAEGEPQREPRAVTRAVGAEDRRGAAGREGPRPRRGPGPAIAREPPLSGSGRGGGGGAAGRWQPGPPPRGVPWPGEGRAARRSRAG